MEHPPRLDDPGAFCERPFVDTKMPLQRSSLTLALSPADVKADLRELVRLSGVNLKEEVRR